MGRPWNLRPSNVTQEPPIKPYANLKPNNETTRNFQLFLTLEHVELHELENK
ncbi:hypothetical protein Sjap_020777 [Stephania japonica]|uniref:Uncharacterized protein n=1 Tax=Stephania japonica TaxID=461633 RepID=A0AAP0F8N7_9MAGN